MAEKVDGLVLDGLKYFYNGSCATGKGTVRMSVRDGYDYLKAIAYSLLSQGFKRQIYVTGHGTSELTLGALVGDFFDETKVPIAWMDQMTVTNFARSRVGEEVAKQYNIFQDVTYGSYQITGQKEDLIIDPKAAPLEVLGEMFKPGQNTFKGLRKVCRIFPILSILAALPYSIVFIWVTFTTMAVTGVHLRLLRKRDEVCARGYEQLLKVVEAVDVPLFVKTDEGSGRIY